MRIVFERIANRCTVTSALPCDFSVKAEIVIVETFRPVVFGVSDGFIGTSDIGESENSTVEVVAEIGGSVVVSSRISLWRRFLRVLGSFPKDARNS